MSYYFTRKSATANANIYTVNLNTTLNNNNYSDITPPININPISYNSGLLDSTTITVTNSSKMSIFSTSGGYILLAYYDYYAYSAPSENSLSKSILVKYESVSGSTLQNITIVGYPPILSSTSFTKIIYFKGNNNLVDGYYNGLINVGNNSITTTNNDLIPVVSNLLRIKGNGITSRDQYVLPITEYRDVLRAQYNTSQAIHSGGTQIMRATKTIDGQLSTGIDGSVTSIPLSNANLFGTTGLILINSEIISYNNSYGITVTERGSLNTFPASHLVSTSYYQYSLGPSTLLRTDVPIDSLNIAVNDPTGLTGNSNSLYMITSATTQTDPEIITSGSWNKSLDGLIRNYLMGNGLDYYVDIINYPPTDVYSLSDLTSPSHLRKTLDGDLSMNQFIPLYDGSGYPFQSSSTHYLLLQSIFNIYNITKIIRRSSLDNLTRNSLSTETATTTLSIQGLLLGTSSTLRQSITSSHIFIPVNNGSSYSSNGGYVVINGEWIQYNNKNSLDGFTRGIYSTPIQDFSYNNNKPVLLVNSITNLRNLRKSLTSTTRAIPLDGVNTNYGQSTIKLALIDQELMRIDSKYTFDFDTINRQQYSTSLFTTIIPIKYIIKEITITQLSTLRANISDISGYIPVQIMDINNFTSGIGLIDGEFFDWTNKNTLDILTRGQEGTTDVTHDINTGVNLVTQLASFNGNYSIPNVTIIGDKVLLSDTTDGIRITDSSNVSDFPLAGTVKIDNEYVLYSSNKALADLTRGTNNTSAGSHTNSDIVYLLSTDTSALIVVTLLYDLTPSTSGFIRLSSTAGFPESGTILIESEIINYTSLIFNNLYGVSRGRFASLPVAHSSGTSVYLVPSTNMYRSQITQNMSPTDSIVSVKDINVFSTTGTILIGSEIITYQSKNALAGLTRSHDNSVAQGYPNLTNIELTNITLTDQESTVLVDTSTGDVSVDLPSAVNVEGRIYTVKKASQNNVVRIIPTGSEVIDDGLTSLPITLNGSFVAIQSDGEKWRVILNSEEPLLQIETAKNEAIATSNAYTDVQIANIQLQILNTDSLAEGVTNLYFTEQRVIDTVSNPSLVTTDIITEGTSNLYFTDARAVLAMTGLYDPAGSADQAEVNAAITATTLVNNKADELIDGAPTSLNTLNKLANAIANNPTFYDTMLDLLATKIDTTAALSLLATKLDVTTATSLLAAKLNISDAALTYLTQTNANTLLAAKLNISDASTTYATLNNSLLTGLTSLQGLKLPFTSNVNQTAGNNTADVTCNGTTGTIYVNAGGATIAANTSVSFTLYNSALSSNDILFIFHKYGFSSNGSAGQGMAMVSVGAMSNGSCQIVLRNQSAYSIGLQMLSFIVIKTATSTF